MLAEIAIDRDARGAQGFGVDAADGNLELEPAAICDGQVLDTQLSDHRPLLVTLK